MGIFRSLFHPRNRGMTVVHCVEEMPMFLIDGSYDADILVESNWKEEA